MRARSLGWTVLALVATGCAAATAPPVTSGDAAVTDLGATDDTAVLDAPDDLGAIDAAAPTDAVAVLDAPTVDAPADVALDGSVDGSVDAARDVVLPTADVAPDVPPDVPADVVAPCGPAGLPCAITTATTTNDLLVQDVCVTAAGVLLPDDPIDACPAGSQRRDLRVGDALPYHRHDQPGTGVPAGYQRHDSFPRPGAGARVVHTFDFAPFGQFDASGDGYDVAEVDGEMASIIGTRDPGGLAQTFFGNGCALDDAWLLLPTTQPSTAGSRIAALRGVGWERAGTPFPGTCPTGLDAAYTQWSHAAVTYGGINGSRAKTLDSVVTDHYGGNSIATADHIERFYFTTVYGLTRWERWQRSDTVTPRSEGCNGAVLEGPFRRVDCRDWTNIQPDARPYPTEAWPTPYADGNILGDGDFGANPGNTWGRLGMSVEGSLTNFSVVDDGAGGTEAATNCGGTCSPGQCIYQDLPRNGLNGTYRFGGAFHAEGGSGAIELVVFQRDAAAAIVSRDAMSVTIDTATRRVLSPPFTLDARTTQLRFTIYLNTPRTVHADDLWVARTGP